MSDVPVNLPSVTCVIATCGRPELLRRAVTAAACQTYGGRLEIIVVFDRIPIDPLDDIRELVVGNHRTLVTIANGRTGGLAGARNTGILRASGSIVAFCDDDDAWEPAKIEAQIEDWQAHREAVAHATGILIETSGVEVVRRAPRTVTFEDFLASRVTEIHPSTLLYRRSDLTGRVGLVDEALPYAYGEDYDLLLRATRFGHVRSLPDPHTRVGWSTASEFSGKWHKMAAGLAYILAKFPEFAQSPGGTARIAGQVAFALAASNRRRESLRWVHSALVRDKRQLRAYAALIVVSGIVPAKVLLRAVQVTGHGL